MKRFSWLPIVLLALAMTATACGKKPPVAKAPDPGAMPRAFPSAEGAGNDSVRPPDPPPIPLGSDISSSPLGNSLDNQPVDAINGPNSPLKPAYFLYDSDEISDEAKKVLAANAEVLKTYPTWIVTVEGHSDERGTAEYNLALGDRRAQAARNYLLSLGIAANRLRTVSYGKEFPFDPGHDETAWSQNRRAHFMLTSK
jgi:peptidoglycan-associated lipoprotein